MNDTVENAVIERQAQPMPVAQVTPMALIERAMATGTSMEQLSKLLDLKERWDAAEAKTAFTEAMAAFKADPPTVIKDKDNKQYGSKYSSIGNLVNTVNIYLGKHGLSAAWKIDQGERIAVTCTLTHRLGHSEQASMSGLPDTSGQKNPLQQIKSTVTYLKIATFEAVTGIASSEGNADDDGNGAGNVSGMPESQRVDFETAIDGAMDAEALAALWKKIVAACNAAKDKPTYDALKAKVSAKGTALAQPKQAEEIPE